MSSSSAKTEKITITCQDGIRLSGERYRTSLMAVANDDGDSSPPPEFRVLCWHGWIDNHRSFCKLAPLLVEHLPGVVDLVALDFPGHGQSSHKSLDGPSMLLMDYVYYVYDAIHQLGWQDQNNIILIGHSMGAAVSLLYAAAFPVNQLILLDSLGPFNKSGKGVAHALRQHCKVRLKGKAPNSVYPSLEEAVETRTLTAKMFPGKQYISKEAARELVLGGGQILLEQEEENDVDGTSKNQWQFSHDQRLKWPSILYMTQDQVDELYSEVASSSLSSSSSSSSTSSTTTTTTTTRTCLLLAQDGMPYEASQVDHVRNLLQPQVLKTLPGSHHFHMDPDTADEVVYTIVDFLMSP